MTFVAYVFSKLQTVKDMARRMFRYSLFRTPFYNQHVKASQTLVKPSSEYFVTLRKADLEKLSVIDI